MSPLDWATRPLKKYADFSGRAPRAEFWWYSLAVCLLAVVAYIVENALSIGPVFWLYGPLTLVIVVATFVPSLAVQFRRLHDTNRSALWLLALWVPYIPYLYSLVGMMGSVTSGATPDMGSAGIVMILGLVVLIAAIVLIVFFASAGTQGPNKYGDDPYAGGASRAM